MLLSSPSPFAPVALAAVGWPSSGARTYQVEIQTELVLGNWTSANTVTAQLRREPPAWATGSPRYAVSLLHFEQTNPHGLHELAGDVARLRSRLLLDTAATGAIAHVANAAELHAQFAALEPFLQKKYQHSELVTAATLHAIGQVLTDGDHLARVLAAAPEYALLFPDVVGQPFSPEPVAHQPRLLPRVLGTLDVPLITRAWAVPAPTGVARAVCVEGHLDPARYRPDDARQAVRVLTGQYDAAAGLTVQHVERYDLSATDEPISAARFTIVAIPGVFFSKTVATLLPAEPVAATPAA